MRHCLSCKQDKPVKAFSGKSEYCKECNEEYVGNVIDLVRRFYQPVYPPHIQEYLDKRRERLEAEGE